MKKFLAILILLLLFGVLTGCSSDGDDTPANYTLKVNTIGDGGTVKISPDKGHYNRNEVVTLTAQPDLNEDWDFAYWEGSGFDGNRNFEITITMSNNVVLNAVFGQVETIIDDFTDNVNEWREDTSDSGNVWEIKNGEYALTLNNTNMIMWGYPANKMYANNLFAEVDYKFQSSDYTEAGFMFNYQDIENYYIFRICTYGTYKISRRVNDNYTTIVDWTDVPSISDPLSVINIKVIKNLNTYNFYVNDDQILDSVTVSNNSPNIALLAASGNDIEPVTVLYDNFEGSFLNVLDTSTQKTSTLNNIDYLENCESIN